MQTLSQTTEKNFSEKISGARERNSNSSKVKLNCSDKKLMILKTQQRDEQRKQWPGPHQRNKAVLKGQCGPTAEQSNQNIWSELKHSGILGIQDDEKFKDSIGACEKKSVG